MKKKKLNLSVKKIDVLWLAHSQGNPEELVSLRGSATISFKTPGAIHVLVISAGVRLY